nr:RIO1 family regulatory kinase/ATPase [Deinobacterium chartae]
MQRLHEAGYFNDLEYEVRSGKEATVYVVSGQRGLLAAKVYTDERLRAFKNAHEYGEGRYVADSRVQRALRERSKTGVSKEQALWIGEEFMQMRALREAGVPVPEAVDLAGRVILMQFIGDEDGPAPRVADADLSSEQAEAALEEAIEAMSRMLRAGRIHGDFSAFNLLWWQDHVVVIDFPQVVDAERHPRAEEFLERDARSLAMSFKRFGLNPEPGALLAEVRRRAREKPAS